jgi:hypothetical protein
MAFIFGGDTGVSYQELQRRRAIAEARAKQNRGFPKTSGEGIYSLGESIGDVLAEKGLTEQERQYYARQQAAPGSPFSAATPPAGAAGTPTPPLPKVSSYAPAEPAPTQWGGPIAAALVNQGIPPSAPGAPGGSVNPDFRRSEEVTQENPTIGTDTSVPGSDSWLARQNAIAGLESGGRYHALGPVTRKGDRAYGKYQVMGANIPDWTEAALGQRLTPEQFRASASAQDAVFRHRFGDYVDRYGEEGAARAWFGGERNINNPQARDQLGTSVGNYGRNYLSRLGGGPTRGGGALALAAPGGVASDAVPILPRVPGGADEAPEPTPTDIQPAPVRVAGSAIAPAPGGLGRIPGAFDPRTPEPAAPPSGLRPADPNAIKPRTKPVAPSRIGEQPTQIEINGWNLIKNFPGDVDMQARGKLLMDYGKAQRDADYERRKAEHDKELAAFEEYEKSERAYARELPAKEQELGEKKRAAAQMLEEQAKFPLGKAKHLELAKDSYETVKNIPAAAAAVSSVKQLLASDAGMFTGSGANMALSMKKMAQALGAPYDPKVSNTETFKGLIVPILAALRPAIVGPGAQSLPELQMLKDAAAGNITLERRSIENILGAVEKLNAVAAADHHRRLIVNSGNDDNMRQALFNNYQMPMEQLVPRGTVELLRKEIAKNPDRAAAEMEEFDRDYHTPGLAKRLLGR